MVLRAITGVRTPACLSATSNPVEAVTPPLWGNANSTLRGASGDYPKQPRGCTMALQRSVSILHPCGHTAMSDVFLPKMREWCLFLTLMDSRDIA